MSISDIVSAKRGAAFQQSLFIFIMKLTGFQELSSCPDYYVRIAQTVRSFLFLMALFCLNSGSTFAHPSGEGNGPETMVLPTPTYSKWVFDLSQLDLENAYTSVSITSECYSICAQGQVTASLDEQSETLTVYLYNCTTIPSGFEEILAGIEVYDRNSSLLETYSMEAGGGEVIVVLIDD